MGGRGVLHVLAWPVAAVGSVRRAEDRHGLPDRRVGSAVLGSDDQFVGSSRVWGPIVYLVAGYWMPALLVPPARGRLRHGW